MFSRIKGKNEQNGPHCVRWDRQAQNSKYCKFSLTYQLNELILKKERAKYDEQSPEMGEETKVRNVKTKFSSIGLSSGVPQREHSLQERTCFVKN